jgi:hypothetical protein
VLVAPPSLRSSHATGTATTQGTESDEQASSTTSGRSTRPDVLRLVVCAADFASRLRSSEDSLGARPAGGTGEAAGVRTVR